MPYEYTADTKIRKKGFFGKLKSLFFVQFHLVSNLFKGFGAYRVAGGILKWMISMGDDQAMYKLGVMYWWGYKYARDPVKAIELIEYSAIRGNKNALKFKEEMTDDGLWRQGKKRDEFMEMYDDHILKENKQSHSTYLLQIVVYTILIVAIAYFARR